MILLTDQSQMASRTHPMYYSLNLRTETQAQCRTMVLLYLTLSPRMKGSSQYELLVTSESLQHRSTNDWLRIRKEFIGLNIGVNLSYYTTREGILSDYEDRSGRIHVSLEEEGDHQRRGNLVQQGFYALLPTYSFSFPTLLSSYLTLHV